MGAKISSTHWEAFGRIWEWLIHQRPDFKGATCRYMDDLLIMCRPEDKKTEKSLASVLDLCEEIGLPLSHEKTVHPTTKLTFLGIVIDSVSQTLAVPQEKRDAVEVELKQLISKRNTKVRNIMSITGKLGYMCNAIPAGLPFLRRMFDAIRGHDKHLWIKIPETAKQDARVWIDFLEHFNGVTRFPPRVLPTKPDINIFTDSSLKGYGIVCGDQWVMEPYPKFDPERSMTWWELFPILVALHVLSQQVENKIVRFNTENTGMFHILHSLTSDVPDIMAIL